VVQRCELGFMKFINVGACDGAMQVLVEDCLAVLVLEMVVSEIEVVKYFLIDVRVLLVQANSVLLLADIST
jgi:hypothetical protein